MEAEIFKYLTGMIAQMTPIEIGIYTYILYLGWEIKGIKKIVSNGLSTKVETTHERTHDIHEELSRVNGMLSMLPCVKTGNKPCP